MTITPTPRGGSGHPSPTTFAFDSRTGGIVSPHDVNLAQRPRAGRIPRKGNVSLRAMRRAEERAARKAVRR
jgi:hypothetical protein